MDRPRSRGYLAGIGGLKTTPSAQVVDVDGETIPGLYAVGNTAARLEFGGGYNSGMAVGRSLVFGYLAGEALAAATT